MATTPSTGNDAIAGTGAGEAISALAGNDTVRAAGGDDTVHGDAGNDKLFGEAGNDRLRGDAGNDEIDGGAGTDAAVFSGSQSQYQITTSGGVTEVKDLRGRGSDTPDGIDKVVDVERLVFADGYRLLVPDQAPEARDDAAATDEDTLVGINVLGNDTDADGDALSIASLSDADPNTAGNQTALGATTSIVNGQVRYDPTTSAQLQALNAGQSLQDSFSYTVSDGFGGTDTAAVAVAVDGANDLARSFDGQTIDYSALVPTIESVFFNADLTVGPGPETGAVGPGDDIVLIDITGTQVLVDPQASSDFSVNDFTGFRVFDEFGVLSDFVGVSVSSNNLAGFDASRISFDADNIYVNLQGLGFNADTLLALDVLFA